MIIPLGLKAYRRQAAFTPETVLRNFYLEKDESGFSPDQVLRIQRPGLTEDSVFTASIRGVGKRTSTNEELVVSGLRLYSNGSDKGAVPGGDIVAMTDTAFLAAIVSGQALYLYTTGVAPLTLPEGYSVQDVDQLNQYLLILTPQGRFYWLEPGSTTLDPLDFATAESSVDKAKAIRRVGDEFWIFGDETTEPWQATGDPDAPFQRATGRIYERGCRSRDTVRRFDNSVMWVTNDGQVARGGAVPQIVSDTGLAERIRLAIGQLSAWVFTFEGHEFYVLNIPGQGTFAYDALTQAWCEFSTGGVDGWAARVGYDRGNSAIICGGASGKLWRLDPDAVTDDGEPIERVVTGTVAFMGRNARNDSLSVGVGASGQCTLRVRWRDGQDDYPAVYDETLVRAPFDVANLYRLGMPDQPHRTFELSCVDPVKVRIAGARANEGWR